MRTLLIFLLASNMSYGQSKEIIPYDKLLHVSAGYVSSSLTTAVLEHYNVKHSMWIGFGVGTVLGIGKEAFDGLSKRGNVEALDAIFSIGGAALGSVTVKFAVRKRIPKNKLALL